MKKKKRTRETKNAITARVENTPVLDKSNICAKVDGNVDTIPTKIINEIITLISKVTDPVKQEIYIKGCSSQLDISERVLFNSLAQIKHFKVPKKQFEKPSTITQISSNDGYLSFVGTKYHCGFTFTRGFPCSCSFNF